MSDRLESLRELERRILDAQHAPGFLEFSNAIGYRIEDGRSVEAMRMLTTLGAPAGLAWQIVDGWIFEGKGRRLAELLPDVRLEACLRLSSFIDDLGRYSWPNVMREAVQKVDGPQSSRPATRPASP